jgi:hypothetical protein
MTDNLHPHTTEFKSPEPARWALGLPCPNCRCDFTTVRWRSRSSGRPQIGARCADCGSWIKWLAQTPENVRLANLNPTPMKTPGNNGLPFEELPRNRANGEL